MKADKGGKTVKDIKNPNHPKTGDMIQVDPIYRLEDIKAVKKILSDKPRDLLLFTLGINSGLRTGDLLRFKVREVRYLKEGDEANIKEEKTGKVNFFNVNKSIFKSIRNYIDKVNPDDEDFLFASRKGREAISVSAVNALMKKWTKAINLQGNYGAHTLRKTFGCIQRTEYCVGYDVLAKRFKHSNPAVTMRYLGIKDKEVRDILKNEI